MINKVVPSVQAAIEGVQDGQTFMLGGFGLCGIPENTITALVASGVKNLTCISNNAGVADFGIGLMLLKHQVKTRSEERRVGKECRSRWSPYH